MFQFVGAWYFYYCDMASCMLAVKSLTQHLSMLSPTTPSTGLLGISSENTPQRWGIRLSWVQEDDCNWGGGGGGGGTGCEGGGGGGGGGHWVVRGGCNSFTSDVEMTNYETGKQKKK